ncbi:MAG: undecaprenyldiphospho-muramoylpentapeptide beta-N-acetylglucosaminyltransferase [Chitinophagaceae bacterium]|nr:undecaprenyldiphospho-muramoylpentapeptide beta-N-acetylglucosaminyltransferase [Chitinophagaceae bacterium]MCA6453670.1 undecaprenyldiphospho-muramoylpentapeptide beta-N-acetylglucosaminyltransferase [Chitinophagaceae bacterium]MCA6456991.1 undecaprenyldiphospho-muramoylpentapeptide beta-N-acetylglucosaminyltransferase [Chitinophagaceae bacterium]MCA6459604.1 undecaprenyldiphospho-muramoylpentapeptide beta-N-acetylglucosaminyltransferase [Chitinophagaceae bacterium]MCA6464471.1 undecaprenyl
MHSDAAAGQKPIRVIIAGGGTGGHIFPAIAIANALKQADNAIEILFVGANGKMEMEKVPQAGYPIKGLDIAGLDRQSLWRNLSLPIKLVKSFLQVRLIIDKFRPDAVIGVGGYSSFPVLRYAQSKRIPTFIHESNSFAGKSNILLGKKATAVFVATDGMERFFPKEKLFVVGNPVRKTIVESKIDHAEALRFFDLDPNKKTVLAIGGSLGARSINESLALHLDEFAQNDLQLIWQTGKTTASEYMMKGGGRKNVWVNDFIKEMEMAYAAADVVISRAGAMSVTEICVVGKPTVFVPFPLAAEDHQTSNAMNLVNREAALIVSDKEAKTKLIATVIALAKDETLQQQLHTNCKALAVNNADEVIAKEILKHIR